jgi:tetratricopeptide (TPR) repeat protein
VAVHRSYVGSLTGDHRLAVTAARTAQRLGRELGDRYLLAEGRLAEGQAMGMAGHPRGVPDLLALDDEFLRTSVGDDRRGQTTTRSVSNLTYMAVAHAQMGSFDDARRIMAERNAIAHAGGRPFDLAFGCWGNGVIELYAGDAVAARTHFAEGVEMSALHDLLYTDALISSQLGAVQHTLGETDVALRSFERAIELARVLESPLITAWARVHRADAHLDRGARAPALADVEAALAFARQHDHPLLEATALRSSAAAADDSALASALLRQAAAICDREQLVTMRRRLGKDLGEADRAGR